jgi:hypothetical protein
VKFLPPLTSFPAQEVRFVVRFVDSAGRKLRWSDLIGPVIRGGRGWIEPAQRGIAHFRARRPGTACRHLVPRSPCGTPGRAAIPRRMMWCYTACQVDNQAYTCYPSGDDRIWVTSGANHRAQFFINHKIFYGVILSDDIPKSLVLVLVPLYSLRIDANKLI